MVIKRVCLLCLAFVLLVNATGCAWHSQNIDKPQDDTTILAAHQPIRFIESNTGSQNNIAYPQFEENTDALQKINALIRDTVHQQVTSLVLTPEETRIEIDYSILICNDAWLSVLFEGTLTVENTAHPTNLAFSLCISMEDQSIADPLTLLSIDSDFLLRFRKQLSVNQNPERFSDDDWKAIEEYVNSFSDEKITELLCAEPSKTIAFAETDIVILFPVPHAIGDYIKITVPQDIMLLKEDLG